MLREVESDIYKVLVSDLILCDRALLAHCGSNLHACKELASIMKEKTNLEKEIFQLHTKYSSVLKEIRPKWEAVQGRVMQVQEESEALTQ